MKKAKVAITCVTTVVAVSVLFAISQARAQVTNNVLLRVLEVRVGNATATGFTVDVDGRQYLITAKHAVANLKSSDKIEIMKDEEWSTLQVDVLRCDDPIDIAVLIPPRQLTISFPMQPISAGLLLGQDVFFAGFPYGQLYERVDTKGNLTNGGIFPLPFLRKATMSAFGNHAGGPGIEMLYLDGHNNFGFSGGPIVFRDVRTGDPNYRVAGVISGFRPEFTPVLNPVKVKAADDLSREEPWRIVNIKGEKFLLKDTNQMVATNSGIVMAYAIDPAVALIRKHPVGPKISQ